MKNKSFLIVCFLIAVFLFALFYSLNKDKIETKISEKDQVMKEINRILLPLANKSITEKDFDVLNTLVKDDEYAAEEVEELVLLAKYKEYAHIGHGLGFLYEYKKTGEKPVCPGHLLAHYYVFMNHNETEAANENLKEAKEKLEELQAEGKNEDGTNLELFERTINEIESGNFTASDEQISVLADASCA